MSIRIDQSGNLLEVSLKKYHLVERLKYGIISVRG